MLIRFGFRSHKMERGGGGRVRSGAGGKVGWILDDSEIFFLFYLWNDLSIYLVNAIKRSRTKHFIFLLVVGQRPGYDREEFYPNAFL